jgi:hypothetical protein
MFLSSRFYYKDKQDNSCYESQQVRGGQKFQQEGQKDKEDQQERE